MSRKEDEVVHVTSLGNYLLAHAPRGSAFDFIEWYRIKYRGTTFHRQDLQEAGISLEFYTALNKRRALEGKRQRDKFGRAEANILAELGEKLRAWREAAGVRTDIEGERISQELTGYPYSFAFLEAGLIFPAMEHISFEVYERFAQRYNAPAEEVQQARSLFEQELPFSF